MTQPYCSEAWDSHWPGNKSPLASPLDDGALRSNTWLPRGAFDEDDEDADTLYTNELLKLRSAVNEKVCRILLFKLLTSAVV